MGLNLKAIDLKKYPSVKKDLFKLMKNIWSKKESYENAIHSIERWHKNNESGIYFFINQDKNRIGITGYWPIKGSEGSYGLRHHGTTIKGTGKLSLGLLIEEIKKREDKFTQLIELIPKGREELIAKFEKWGFKLDPKGVPEWEPKKDYYEYAMVRIL